MTSAPAELAANSPHAAEALQRRRTALIAEGRLLRASLQRDVAASIRLSTTALRWQQQWSAAGQALALETLLRALGSTHMLRWLRIARWLLQGWRLLLRH